MKKRLLISFVFLLTAFTSWSQIDSNRYWFNGEQLRSIYQIILERDYYEEANTTLIELVALNDSLQKENVEARKNLEQQLQTRTQQYLNTELKSDQEHEKFIIADTAYKEEMLKKNIYQGTTIVAIIAFLVALFI